MRTPSFAIWTRDRRSTAHRRDSDITTSGTRSVGRRFQAARSCFSSSREEWRRSTRDETAEWRTVPDPTWLTDPASPNYVPPEARDPNAVKLLTLWPAPNVPGTNRYRTTITNELDTRQEFVRADYNLNGNWSLKGRYLHDRLDSGGEYITEPDSRPGHRYLVGHLAVVEARRVGGRFLHELSYQLSRNRISRDDLMHTRGDLGILIPEVFPENAADLMPHNLC